MGLIFPHKLYKFELRGQRQRKSKRLKAREGFNMRVIISGGLENGGHPMARNASVKLLRVAPG